MRKSPVGSGGGYESLEDSTFVFPDSDDPLEVLLHDNIDAQTLIESSHTDSDIAIFHIPVKVLEKYRRTLSIELR